MLIWGATILGIVASVVTLVAFLFPDLGKRVLSSVVRGPRFNWASVPRGIANAKTRVYVLQTWLPGLRLELPWWREALGRKDVEFRILLLEQKLVPLRLRCRERVSSLLPQNVSDLAELASTYNSPGKGRIEVRFYSCLPFGPIYVIDDEVHWGLYLANIDSMLGPAFRHGANSALGKLILASFEATWRSASARSGALCVPHVTTATSHAIEESEIVRQCAPLSVQFERAAEPDHSPVDHEGCLLILRHGDTDLNAAGIVTGALDVGINTKGRLAARQANKVLRGQHWTRVYSSPLRRCIETLSEVLGGSPVGMELRDELRERCMGEVEGFSKLHYRESLTHYGGTDLLRSFHTAATGGEAYCDVFWRLIPLLTQLAAYVRAGERVLVCSHEAPIRVMIMALEGLAPDQALRVEVPNTSMFKYTLPPRTALARADGLARVNAS